MQPIRRVGVGRLLCRQRYFDDAGRLVRSMVTAGLPGAGAVLSGIAAENLSARNSRGESILRPGRSFVQRRVAGGH
jgi:hypothetical protein